MIFSSVSCRLQPLVFPYFNIECLWHITSYNKIIWICCCFFFFLCIAVSNAVCFLYDTGWLYGDTVPTTSFIKRVLLEKRIYISCMGKLCPTWQWKVTYSNMDFTGPVMLGVDEGQRFGEWSQCLVECRTWYDKQIWLLACSFSENLIMPFTVRSHSRDCIVGRPGCVMYISKQNLCINFKVFI